MRLSIWRRLVHRVRLMLLLVSRGRLTKRIRSLHYVQVESELVSCLLT